MNRKMRILCWLALLITTTLWAQPTDRRYDYAKSYEESGDWERAAQLYQRLYNEDPRKEYFEGLVRTYLQLHRYSELERIVAARLHTHPTVELYALEGDLLWKLGKTREAAQAWDQAIRLAPQDPETYRTIATAQLRNRLYAAAIETLLQARTALDNPFLFSEDLIQLYGATQQYRKGTEEALQLLKRKKNVSWIQGRIAAFLISQKGIREVSAVLDSAAQYNDSPAFLILYEWFLRETKQYDKALEVVKRLDPYRQPRGRALYDFARLCFQEGHYDVALKAYEAVMDLGKNSSFYQGAMYGAVRCLEMLTLSNHRLEPEQLEEVEAKYAEIIERFPNSHFAAQALHRLARLALQYHNDLNKAEVYLKRAAAFGRFDQIASQALLDLADLFIRKDQLDSARKYYHRILQRYGQRQAAAKLQAEYGLGLLEFFQGNLDSAKAYFGKVAAHLESDAANDALAGIILLENYRSVGEQEALRWLARGMLRQRQQRYEEAQELYQKALQRAGTSELGAFIQLQLANIHFQQHHFETALQFLDRILAQYPRTIFADRILWLKGNIYEAQHQNDKAVESYSTILLKHPRSPLVPLVRQRIKALNGDV